jgi:oligoribonuclease
MTLSALDGPLVWIDCEVWAWTSHILRFISLIFPFQMTGLDYKKDKIIEIAVLITDKNLELVDETGLHFAIQTSQDILEHMNDWCIKQHGAVSRTGVIVLAKNTDISCCQSGLTQACAESPYPYEVVYASVLKYIKSWIPEERVGVLAGNSVHMDRIFLAEGMPRIVEHLHYR